MESGSPISDLRDAVAENITARIRTVNVSDESGERTFVVESYCVVITTEKL